MNKTRNYGIDLLRLVAMYMVVILHILGHGGALAESGINFYITWFFETAAFCAVDCFTIISGYVGYSPVGKKSGRIGKILSFWVQVFFWSFGITLFFFLRGEVGIKIFINSALPVSSNAYWYVSSYYPVLILSPWLNKFITGLDEKETKRVLIVIGGVFSVYSLIAFTDPFKLEDGYSALWFILMYLTGAGLKKLEIPKKIKTKVSVILLIACLLFSWLRKCFSPVGVNKLLNYTSPTIVAIAIILICLFSKFKLTGKLINIVAPAAFGVYLIHDNSLIRSNLMSGAFSWITTSQPIIVPFAILGSAFGVFIVCLCLEKIRLLIFKAFRINKLIVRIGESFENNMRMLGKMRWLDNRS